MQERRYSLNTNIDYYKVLNLNQNAKQDEIKSAYRKLAKEFHPDLHISNPLAELASEKFKLVNEAYEILSDEKKREEYNLRTKFVNNNYSEGSSSSNSPSDKNKKSSYKETADEYSKSNNKYNDNGSEYNSTNKQGSTNERRDTNGQKKAYYHANKGYNTHYSCYLHKNDIAVDKCVICHAPLCQECTSIFDKPICVDCLKKNNDQYIKHLKTTFFVAVFSLIFGGTVGVLLGLNYNIISHYGIAEGFISGIYLTVVWLYLRYFSESFNRVCVKVLEFLLGIFDANEETVYFLVLILSTIFAMFIGWVFGVMFGIKKLFNDYKIYRDFIPEYKRTNQFIKEKFNI